MKPGEREERGERAEPPGVLLRVDGGVATIALHRPPVNALGMSAQDALREAALEAARREDVAAVVLDGGPERFSAGADIRELADRPAAELVWWTTRLQDAFTAVADIPKPVVAAITGYALGGGCELALTADHRVLGESAVIGLPEIRLGVMPGAGGTQRLARLVGSARAKELMFTGRSLGAREAERVGLVDAVVPDDRVGAHARAWAAQFVGGPALALRAVKKAVDQGGGAGLHDGLQIEQALFAGLFATDDRTKGMRAFLDGGKEAPRFTGS